MTASLYRPPELPTGLDETLRKRNPVEKKRYCNGGARLGCELRWRACRLTSISASIVYNGESAIDLSL
ncbi:hypothetical protein DY000_02036992 [Brassica cretica]|uniref:Uncharacterized protein n=1 Tax=Brassica cretica TaxID=69181 RepID=A0ABQ7B911_BRACR|nr:hypothetical protein DY000_02036992 [Brassica cretica]